LFLFAGHEATANTIGFLIQELAKHPDMQEKFIQEIDKILGQYEGQVVYEAVASMTYLDMIVSEVLRMYPPGARVERRCDVDEYNLNGIKLKKGCLFTVPLYSLHHNPEFYPDPEKFDPDRFSSENKKLRNPYTYMPFGVGPRNCIAMRFALTEIKLVAVCLFSKFRFKTCRESETDCVKAGNFGTLKPDSIHLAIHKRDDVPVY